MARPLHVVILLIGFSVAAGEIKNVGWWKNAVFYQVYPRSFKDDNNDGIGDLKGITSKLDHLKDAGVDAVWLSPIYASPMADFGYDISDYRQVHPDFGTNDDLVALVTKANELGLKVVLDLVPNHTSDKHAWFIASEANDETYKDYYIWRDGKAEGQPPNNWLSRFGYSAWKYSETRKQWYLHQFLAEQPDLNYRNPKVQQEMADVMKFWLSQGIEGFRVDAVPFLFEFADLKDEPKSNLPNVADHEWEYLIHDYTQDLDETYDEVASWRKVLDNYANASNTDEKVMMTEAYTSLTNATRYYDVGTHVPFNFRFISDVNSTSSPAEFKQIIDDWVGETNKRKGAVPNWVMGNHDVARTASRYTDRGEQMTMLAMILPGVAVTYYGEEIGMVDKRDISWEETQDPQACLAGKDKYQQASRDPNRTPMQWDDSANAGFNTGTKPWLPVHENYVDLNLAAQKSAKKSIYKNYQKLIKLRKNRAALKSGALKTFVSSDKKLLAVVRTSDTESVILVINFSDTESAFINLTEQLASVNPAATVEVATIGSPVEAGSLVNLRKLTVAAKQSLVLSAKIKSSSRNCPFVTKTMCDLFNH